MAVGMRNSKATLMLDHIVVNATDLEVSRPFYERALAPLGMSVLYSFPGLPGGFAHGFCVLSDWADVTYKCSSYYDAATERGLAYDDPDLASSGPAGSS